MNSPSPINGKLLVGALLFFVTLLFTQATSLAAEAGMKQFLLDLLSESSPSGPDFDGDGIPDALDPDDDNDGIPDVYELSINFNPMNAADGAMDEDGDGASNAEEYLAQSDIFDFFDCGGSTCTYDPQPTPNQITVPPADSISDAVGAIAGKLNVNNSGSVSYTIPLTTPVGIAGLAPNLALSYNSGAGNGVLGLGWSMSSMSVIRRCPQTLVQDGNAEEVEFDSDDRFCLDGQRLVLKNPTDTYGAPGIEYRTEIDSDRKIISYGTQGNGPYSFKVWDDDGSVSTYGDTPDSRLRPPGSGSSALLWARNDVKDATSVKAANQYSNRISYSYLIDAAEFKLDKIEYAYAGAYSNSPPEAVIQFHYEIRPDTSTTFRHGTSFRVTNRLSSIDVKNEGITVRTYDLKYLDEQISAGDNKASKLAAISECRGSVCLPDTEFTWSDASIDFGFESTSTALSGFTGYMQHAASSTFSPMDTSSSITANINGDGNRDLIWMEPYSNKYRFRIATSNGVTLSTDSYASDQFEKIYGWSVTDYDQDGYSDFLVVTVDNSVETLRLFLNEDQGGGVRGYDVTPITLISDLNYTMGTLNLERAAFSDINNDGLLDITYNGKYRLLEDDALEVNGAYKFGSETAFDQTAIDAVALTVYQSSAFQVDVNTIGYTFLGIGIDQMRIGADFNGDGLADAIAPMVHENCTNCETIAAQLILLSDGAGGYTSFDYFTIDDDYSIADLNRDGLPDILCGNGVIEFNNGTALEAGITSPGITGHMMHSLIDYNLDGFSDFVYKEDGTTALKVLLWEGSYYPLSDNHFADPATEAITIANTNYTEAYGPAGSFFDINGDGLLDYVNFSTGVYLGEDASTTGNSTKAYNLVTKITDGLGNEKSIEYKPLTDNTIYTRESDAVDLDWGEVVFDFISPRYVASEVTNAVPAYDEQTSGFNINANSSVSYTYEGLKTQPAGRGSLGFHVTSITDEQTGITTKNTFLQEFPFTGLLKKTETFVPNNATALNETNFTYTKLANLNGANAVPLRPVLTQSVTNNQAADTITASSQVTISGVLNTVTTLFENYDAYGNVGKTTATITGDGTTYSTVSENTYSNDSSRWYIGRVLTTKVTTSQTGSPNVVREAAFTYDNTTGLLATEVQEPNVALYTLTTTYLRDSFGNRLRATESGSGVTSRYTRVEYDAYGRYIDKVYNSLEQLVSQVISRDAFGQPTVTSNINGVQTYTGYGTLGRQYFEGNDSGSSSQTEIRSCASVTCPTGASYRERNFAADGSEAFVFYDNLARPIQQQVKGFDGLLTSTDIQYDRSGRLRFSSNPYLPSSTVLWTGREYDILGRATKVTDPANNVSSSGYARHTNGSFVGMELTATNAEGQVKTSISNGRGLADEITDDLGGRIGYEYDARGNLTKLISKGTTGTPLNIESVISYDLLGRRSSLDDPDQGIWNYEYSRFGEMTKQTNALNQSSTMGYDALGRIISRLDKESDGTTVEGSATWGYIASGNGLGQLDTVSDSVNDYAKVFNYDNLGRVIQTYTELGVNAADGTFNEYVTYDAIGRQFQQIDATNHGMQFTYNSNGYMEKILEATDTAKEYYKVEGIDAWGNVSQAKLGNGLTEQRTFHAETGLPNRVLVTNPLAQEIQDNLYTFNKIGILTNRDRLIESNSTTLSETFHYDELNRLTQASATGLPSQTFSYDITGNMLTKSDVGTYTYGAGGAGPHAVTGAGGDTYTYDAAGNMLTGGGRTVTYNTFRKPTQLVKGGHTTSFEYGPDRARYKRVDTDGTTTKTTLYVGNVELISHSGGASESKRYIADVAVVTDTSTSSHSEHYTHKDSLGSTDVITNAVGAVVTEMSFDAFGMRRNLLTLADLLSGDYNTLNDFTTRGFTGHEMLDEVGVIHMNGRVYDANLGRFMSADPVVQDMSNVQNLNRYSYVLNSPLSFTDSTGLRLDPFEGGGFGGELWGFNPGFNLENFFGPPQDFIPGNENGFSNDEIDGIIAKAIKGLIEAKIANPDLEYDSTESTNTNSNNSDSSDNDIIQIKIDGATATITGDVDLDFDNIFVGPLANTGDSEEPDEQIFIFEKEAICEIASECREFVPGDPVQEDRYEPLTSDILSIPDSFGDLKNKIFVAGEILLGTAQLVASQYRVHYVDTVRYDYEQVKVEATTYTTRGGKLGGGRESTYFIPDPNGTYTRVVEGSKRIEIVPIHDVPFNKR